MGIGGLSEEFTTLFRRAFVSRLLPPSFMKKLNIKQVKGVLLYGPPGTGKTLIARKIGEMGQKFLINMLARQKKTLGHYLLMLKQNNSPKDINHNSI